jgi:hypothetical protein
MHCWNPRAEPSRRTNIGALSKFGCNASLSALPLLYFVALVEFLFGLDNPKLLLQLESFVFHPAFDLQ